MNPLVSIIIPVYNGENYIKNIQQSLDNQSFQDFEVIFVNDGSTDKSGETLELIKRHNDKYRVLTQKNKGVSAARNAGIKAAVGKYISFVDVDDQLHPHFLKMMIKQVKDVNIISICKFSDTITDIDEQNINVISINREELLEEFLYGRIRIGVWGIVVAKELLDKYKLYFKEGFRYSEDLHMLWRIFCHIEKAVILDAPLYIYNMVENSAMTKMDDSRFDSIKLTLNLNSYIKKECPDFYPQFDTFAVPRMAWSLLWQAAHYLRYKEFVYFIRQYDFKTDMKKLISFPERKVAITAFIFLLSTFLYYVLIKIASSKYRR